MPTPIIELEAIRGTDFSQIVTLSDNQNAPVSTNNAQGFETPFSGTRTEASDGTDSDSNLDNVA